VSTLHEKLLAELDSYERAMPQPGNLIDALRAVVELHAPTEDRIGDRLVRFECQGCDTGGGYDWEYPRWPCSTIQAIARELGVDGG
jgi:hypothetical protein